MLPSGTAGPRRVLTQSGVANSFGDMAPGDACKVEIASWNVIDYRLKAARIADLHGGERS